MPGWSDILISNPKPLLSVPVSIQLATLNLEFHCPWPHAFRIHSYIYSPDSCQPWLVMSWNYLVFHRLGYVGFEVSHQTQRKGRMMGLSVRETCFCMCSTLQVQSIMRQCCESSYSLDKGGSHWFLKWDLRTWDEKFSDFYFSAQIPLSYASEPHSFLVIFLSFLKYQTSLFMEVTLHYYNMVIASVLKYSFPRTRGSERLLQIYSLSFLPPVCFINWLVSGLHCSRSQLPPWCL